MYVCTQNVNLRYFNKSRQFPKIKIVCTDPIFGQDSQINFENGTKGMIFLSLFKPFEKKDRNNTLDVMLLPAETGTVSVPGSGTNTGSGYLVRSSRQSNQVPVSLLPPSLSYQAHAGIPDPCISQYMFIVLSYNHSVAYQG